jgi:hypothetical protein
VDEARAVHRLERGANRFAVTREPAAQPAQAVGVGRGGAELDRGVLVVEQVEVETLAAEIQSGLQH